MDVKAQVKYVRISPVKVKRVLDVIRGKSILEAEYTLKYLPMRAAEVTYKVLKSAVANAVNNNNMKKDSLFISTAFVNGGPVFKRFRARARGRINQIIKKTSHITICVDERSSM